MSSSATRVTQLDGWRGISILLVLSAHLLPLGPAALQLNFAAGLAGMSLFFALSGFLITKFLLVRPEPKSFIIRRVMRILPLAWLVLLVLTPFLEPRDPYHILLRFLFVQNYISEAGTPATSHFWSLCMELHFYAGITLLVTFGKARALKLLPLFSLLITGYRVATGTYAAIATHARLDEILSGATLALIMVEPSWARAKAALARIPLPIFFVFWLLSCHPSGLALNYLRPYFAAGLVGASLMKSSGALHSLLASKVLRYLAEVSYAVYVIHGPLRTGWFSEGSSMERYLIKRPVTIALTFGLAHLSTFYYEHRMIQWARRLTTPRERLPKS